MTVHQRRAAKAAREVRLHLNTWDAFKFVRPMKVVIGDSALNPFRIIRVNYRRGTLRMEGMIRL